MGRRTAGLLPVLLIGGVLGLATPASADPVITPVTGDDTGAAQLAAAIASDTSFVAGASFDEFPGEQPAATSDVALTGFPTDGNAFAILTSGDATEADDEDQEGVFPSTSNGGGSRGEGNDRDVLVLKVNLSVPANRNCLSVDFRFLSEEYPDYVGQSYNDAFIAELDGTTWTASGETISAPNNFAFDADGNVVSINSSGVTGMSNAEAAGTPYGGATVQLSASTPVTGGPHSLYLSLFDQGDNAYDSAVFLDDLSLGTAVEGACEPGATLPPPEVTKTADADISAPGGANGYTISVSNPNDEAISIDSIVDTLPAGFTYEEGSTTGKTTDDPGIEGQTLTWADEFSVPANDSISLSFDVTVSDQAGEYVNEAGATATGFTIESDTATVTVPEPLTMDKTADNETTEAGGTNGYTISVDNPNAQPVTLDSVTDTLPAGFSYVSGTTTGASEPSSVEGRSVTWSGPLSVPADGQLQISFDVTVPDQLGAYLNEADAEAAGAYSVSGTGPTASITVLEPPGPCDPVTVEGATEGANKLIGSEEIDFIRGLGGRDYINGLGGNDNLCGDERGDYLYGRDGRDEMYGDAGNDRMYGGPLGDILEGGGGHDALIAGPGVDTIEARDGVMDCILADVGVDIIRRDQGLDLLNPSGGCPAGFWT
jgi:uncharacterized repeat protein (TIGR01451 family)